LCADAQGQGECCWPGCTSQTGAPQIFFRGFGPPLVKQGWFSHSGYRGGVRGGSFGRKDGLDCANPTFEQMAWHWFYSFGTNPNAESFVRSRARFLISGGSLEQHLVD
jgi:hypothetical protein